MSIPFAVITLLSYFPPLSELTAASSTPARSSQTKGKATTTSPPSLTQTTPPLVPTTLSPPLSPTRFEAEALLRDLSQAQTLMGALDERIELLSEEADSRRRTAPGTPPRSRPGIQERKSSIDTEKILKQSRKLLERTKEERREQEERLERLALAEVQTDQTVGSPGGKRRPRNPRSYPTGE